MSKIEVNEIARRSGSSPIPIPGHVIQVVTGNLTSLLSASGTTIAVSYTHLTLPTIE